jgi:hypothetical protein
MSLSLETAAFYMQASDSRGSGLLFIIFLIALVSGIIISDGLDYDE